MPWHIVAHIKLVVTFCAYGFSGLINYSAYSVVLKRENAYSTALQDYFECESTGISPNKTCERSIFESLDPTEFTFPITIVSFVILPLATLLYVTNIKKLMTKFKCNKKKATTVQTYS